MLSHLIPLTAFAALAVADFQVWYGTITDFPTGAPSGGGGTIVEFFNKPPSCDDAQNNPAYYYQDNTRDPVEDAVVQVFHADGSPAAPLDGLPIDSMVINDGHPPDNQVPYFITSCQLGLITFRVDANDGNTYHMTTDDGVEHATCTVDSTAPELSCFGQLSLDAAKLWNCASPCNIPDAAM